MSYAHARETLADQTRFVPDSPAEGVLSEDLTPALADATTFALIVDEISAKVEESGVGVIGNLDARGSLLGPAVAYKLGLGVLAIHKRSKLPPPVLTETYGLEYGTTTLEIPASGIGLEGKKAVLVDDVLATGGALRAARVLLEMAGIEVTELCTMLEAEGLGAQGELTNLPLYVTNKG